MSKEYDKIVDQAKKRFVAIKDEMKEMHDVGDRCNRMVAGNQWDPEDAKSRKNSNRPIVTINKLEGPVNIVANKNAMERSRIKVSPFEDADKDKARVINGLIKHIQYSEKSNADLAYAKAFSDACTRGYGYIRVNTEYLDENAFDQEIVIEQIEDPDSVFLDPDGNFCFITQWLKKEDYEEKYPDADPVSLSDVDPKDVFFKADEQEICVVEYWVKEEEPITIYKIRIPKVIPDTIQQDTLENIDQIFAPQEPELEEIVVNEEDLKNYHEYEELSKRKSKKTVIKQYIIGGKEILEKNDWAGKYIPIVGVYGKKFKLDGKVFYKSLIYDAIDPQRMYNFFRSQQAELLMQQPKSPWIGAEGQFEGHEDEFEKANTEATPYLQYNPVATNGQLAPPPQRTQPPQVQAGFVDSVHQSSDEIKATTGLFDASLGAQGNEKSGKAILARQQQGEMGTYHFTLSFNEALRQTGLIIVNLIPYIYDTARTIRILGEDMKDEVIKINQAFTDKNGRQVIYDLTTGTYDVTIETGPALNTRRMDAAENLLQLAQYVPQIGPVMADLIVKNFDVEYSDELAERAKAAIDPAILARVEQYRQQEKGGASPEQQQIMMLNQKLQQAMQQLQQAGQTLQQLGNENGQLKKAIQNNRIQETQIKAQADVMGEKIKADGQVQQEQIRARAGMFQNLQPMPMR